MNQAEVDPTQLLKGVLDLAVLAVLAEADSYGYDVVRRLRENGLDHVGDMVHRLAGRRILIRHGTMLLIVDQRIPAYRDNGDWRHG